jgi:hypothetical protein
MRTWVDEGYLDVVRGRPCLSCGAMGAEAHHLVARRWREAFRNDFTAVPLCRRCHTLAHAGRLSLDAREVARAIGDQLAEYLQAKEESG